MNTLIKIFKPIEKDTVFFKRLVTYTFIGAFLLNWILFFVMILDGSLFVDDNQSSYVFAAMSLHALLMTYVVYGGIAAYFDKKNQNKDLQRLRGGYLSMVFHKKSKKRSGLNEKLEINNFKDYYTGLFKNIILNAFDGLVSTFLMTLLLSGGFMLEIFTSAMVVFFIDANRQYFVVGIAYYIYITYILIYLGLYVRNKITLESWEITCSKYFRKLIFFAILVVLFYIFFVKD